MRKNLPSLLVSDLKIIFRDKSLLLLFLLPIVFIILLHFGIPALIKSVPAIYPFQFLFQAFFTLLTAIFPAFVFSFIMLEEKESNVREVWRIVPFHPFALLLFRFFFILLFSGFFALLIIISGNQGSIQPFKVMAASLLISLSAPLAALPVLTFARNKVEGLTAMKILNMLFSLPVITLFIPIPWNWLGGFFPSFWIFNIFKEWNNPSLFWISFGFGILLHGLYILLFFRIYQRKNR